MTTPPASGGERLSQKEGTEKIAAIMAALCGLTLVNAAACLLAALSEVVDQAADKDAAWEVVLLLIEAKRSDA
jgi:hypothetical protein